MHSMSLREVAMARRSGRGDDSERQQQHGERLRGSDLLMIHSSHALVHTFLMQRVRDGPLCVLERYLTP